MASECIIAGQNATGTFTPSGLNNGGKITTVSLNAVTWSALPATALAGRNAICIQNASALEIKINYASDIVGYTGIIIPANGERYYDVTDSIVIYGKSTSGTPDVIIEEIS